MHFFNENRKKNGWRNNSVLGWFSILFWTTILSHYSFTEYLKRSLKMSQIVVRLYVYVEAIIWICQRCESDASMLHLLLRWIRILRLELDGVIATFSCIDRSITHVHVHCSKLKMCSWNHKRTAQNTHTLNWTVAMSPHLEFFPFFFSFRNYFNVLIQLYSQLNQRKSVLRIWKGNTGFRLSYWTVVRVQKLLLLTRIHQRTQQSIQNASQPGTIEALPNGHDTITNSNVCEAVCSLPFFHRLYSAVANHWRKTRHWSLLRVLSNMCVVSSEPATGKPCEYSLFGARASYTLLVLCLPAIQSLTNIIKAEVLFSKISKRTGLQAFNPTVCHNSHYFHIFIEWAVVGASRQRLSDFFFLNTFVQAWNIGKKYWITLE